MDKFGRSQSVRRFEDQRFTTGHGLYVDDIAPEGALFAVFVRSQVAHGALSLAEGQVRPAVTLWLYVEMGPIPHYTS